MARPLAGLVGINRHTKPKRFAWQNEKPEILSVNQSGMNGNCKFFNLSLKRIHNSRRLYIKQQPIQSRRMQRKQLTLLTWTEHFQTNWVFLLCLMPFCLFAACSGCALVHARQIYQIHGLYVQLYWLARLKAASVFHPYSVVKLPLKWANFQWEIQGSLEYI